MNDKKISKNSLLENYMIEQLIIDKSNLSLSNDFKFFKKPGDDYHFLDPDESTFKYSHPIEYWFVVIGLAIGYGSFWRFPYLVYSCG